MSTRACIKIKASYYPTERDYAAGRKVARYILLYHHSDGMPRGVGADLTEFLRNRQDGYFKKREWDAEKIATDLVRGECLTAKQYGGYEGVHRDMGYVPAMCQHGDCEYGYLIDCDALTLTCYELDYDKYGEEWQEKDIVEIPDLYHDKRLELPAL